MRDNKNAPQALICGECFDRQSNVPAFSHDEFYCEHHQVWAIRRPDGGWLLSTQVTPEDHKALVEDARRLQTLDDPAPMALSATCLH